MMIRRVPPNRPDVAELLHVERLTLGDSDLTVDEALAVLATPAHVCWGAYVEASLVGFLSCFETLSLSGLRLELDMLGVLPAHRNQGIATKLISTALAFARSASATTARAVVRNDNPASLRAFAKSGLGVTGEATMLIWDRASEGMSASVVGEPSFASHRHALYPHLLATGATMGGATATVQRVSTLADRGCWLEDLEGDDSLEIATLATELGRRALAEGQHEAGLLLPVSEEVVRAALAAAGWQEAGVFYTLSWSA